MTWWRKRTSERDALRRTLTGIQVKTEMQVALNEMRSAFDRMEVALTLMPDEEDTNGE